MSKLLPPRFGDTFVPRTQAAPHYSDTAAVFGLSGGSGVTGEKARAAELVRQYTYWTFVALRPICNLFAEQRPQLSVTTARRGVGRLSQADRRWVQRSYGAAWLQHDAADLEPLADGHPLRVLLEQINPLDCWAEFAIETCQMWHLTGRFLWWAVPNALRVPLELYVIPTPWATPQWTKGGTLSHYEVRTEAGETWEIPAAEVIEGKFKSPLGKHAAYSPLVAAPGWHNGTGYIERARELAFKRGVNPDLIVELAAENGYPDRAILDRIEAKFLSRVGGVEEAGRPLFLPPGIKASPWSHAPREMAFTESADQNRDDVLALWGSNRAVCGLTEDVNRASFEGAMVAFCRMTINPLLSQFAGILTEKLAPRFDERIRVWFQDCTPEDAEFGLKRAEAAFRMGALTPAEQRAAMGLPPIEEPAYQTGYIAAGLVPLSEAAREVMPDPEAGGDDEDAVADDKAAADEEE